MPLPDHPPPAPDDAGPDATYRLAEPDPPAADDLLHVPHPHARPTRSPESAPRCPRCGYLLYGLPELRCPECGHEVTDDDLAAARLLADDSAADRAAIRRERAMLWIGVAALSGGLAGAVAFTWTSMRSPSGASNVVVLFLASGLTAGRIAWKTFVDPPPHRTVFVMGIVWLVAVAILFHA